jgi:cytochrome c-type biogenesis protein CcmE
MTVVIPFLLILAGLAGLIAMGVAQGGIPELQVSELKSGEFADRIVKVHAMLASVESETRPLKFTISDKEDPALLIPVVYDATKPDTFTVGYELAVEGTWDETAGTFDAEHVYTKCPSKYEAESKEMKADGQAAEVPYRAPTKPDSEPVNAD